MTDCLRRLALSCAALLCALALSSCLDQYSEEMEIHADLSGEAMVTVKLPDTLLDKFDGVHTAFTEANIRKRFDKASGVKLEEYSITEGRHPEVTLKVSFSSLEKLSEAAKENDPAQMLIGQFTVTKEGDHTLVERKLGLGKATMELPNDKNALYKLHFDMPVEVVHTDSGFYDKSHGDLRYRWTLAEIAAQQPSMVNRVTKPLPWAWIAVSIFAVIVLAWFAWKQMGTLKKKKKSKPTPAPPAPGPNPVVTPNPSSSAKPGPQMPQRPGLPPRPGPSRRPGPPTP